MVINNDRNGLNEKILKLILRAKIINNQYHI